MQKDNEKTLGSWEGFINKPTEQLSGGGGEQREAAVQRGSAQLLGFLPVPSCPATPQPLCQRGCTLWIAATFSWSLGFN